MIAELLLIAITISGDNPQFEQITQTTTDRTEYASNILLVGTSAENIPVPAKRYGNYDTSHYRYLSKRHTDIAVLHTGYKRVIYWKRIRSRTWKKQITSQLEELTIILIVISVI